MTRDTITDDDFILSLKSDNKYIPIHGNFHLGTSSKKVFIRKPDFEKSGESNTIGNIRKAFDLGYNATIIIGEKTFYFARGVMYDSNFNILMLIAQEKENNLKVIPTILPKDLKGNTDFVFFYSTELMINPKYATLHRRMHKEIVIPYLIKGMEVRILSSSIIAENTFVRKTVIKKFSSLDKLDNYLKEVLPTFLYENRVEEPESIEEERQISSVFTDTPGVIGEASNVTFNSTTWSGNEVHDFFPNTGIDEQLTEEDQDEDDGLTDASWNEELPVEEEALLYDVPDREYVVYTSAEGAQAFEDALTASLEQEAHDYEYEEEPEEDIQSEQEMEASWFEEQERLVDERLRTLTVVSSDAISGLSTDDVIIHSPVVVGSNVHWRATLSRRRSTWREERIELIDDTSSIELIDDIE